MSAVARWMARWIWRGILWLMRRNCMKSMQRASLRIFPHSIRKQVWTNMVRQNRFARRIGLPMLTFMMNLVLASLIITGTFMTAMHLYDSGYLTIPWRLRKHLTQ